MEKTVVKIQSEYDFETFPKLKNKENCDLNLKALEGKILKQSLVYEVQDTDEGLKLKSVLKVKVLQVTKSEYHLTENSARFSVFADAEILNNV